MSLEEKLRHIESDRKMALWMNPITGKTYLDELDRLEADVLERINKLLLIIYD